MSDQPSALRAYICLARMHLWPIGSELFFLPAAWAIGLAAKSNSIPPLQVAELLAVYIGGATVVHCCACILNDICDVEFDRQVERTKSRPLVSGAITISKAWIYMIPWIATLLWLLHQGNNLTWTNGLFYLFPLNGLYPLMKRWTYWPQAWLGLTINWAFVLGWTTVTGAVNYSVVVPFVLAGTCWTIIYDTIYACQDAKDGIKAGVKSTALLFGDYIRPILSFFAAAAIALFLMGGIANRSGPTYFLVAIPIPSAYFVWLLHTLKRDELEDCGRKFTGSAKLGYVVLLGIIVDYLLSLGI